MQQHHLTHDEVKEVARDVISAMKGNPLPAEKRSTEKGATMSHEEADELLAQELYAVSPQGRAAGVKDPVLPNHAIPVVLPAADSHEQTTQGDDELASEIFALGMSERKGADQPGEPETFFQGDSEPAGVDAAAEEPGDSDLADELFAFTKGGEK